MTSVLSQDLTLECVFRESWDYTCVLTDITVLDPDQNIIIGGVHLENRTNDDVRVVMVENSNTPFVIQQIFETFRNIDDLQIYNSNLQSIRIPDIVQLSEVFIEGNNISRIENGSFDGQSNLWYLNLRDNNILEVDEDAFIGLEALETLNLIGNHIQSLHPRTLHPLARLNLLDLERNNMTSISDELFTQNPLITTLYLEYNQIEEISPRLIAIFNNLNFINLLGNRCINRLFSMFNNDEFNFIILHNSLRTCYNNFIGSESTMKRVTLEFEGPMKLYDEFGNLVASL